MRTPHPKRWDFVLLAARSELPQQSGVYAVIKRGKVYYIGFSSNLQQRWRGKSHHRFSQASKLGCPRLHYVLLPKEPARHLEKQLIAHYNPPWNYSKVPGTQKTNWIPRVLALGIGLIVFSISQSLVLGLLAVAIALLR